MFKAINNRVIKGGKPYVFGLFSALIFIFIAIPAKADVVTDWNEIADAIIVTNAKRAPGAALVDMAYVHAAIYDAVNAIDGRHSVYAVRISNVPASASKEAAAIAAAFYVLKTLFPNQQSFLETKYSENLALIQDGDSKTDGIAVGETVATRFLEKRAKDGRNADVPFIQKTNAGAWQPTLPAFAPPLTPWISQMQPFMIAAPSQFRPAGPPAFTSRKWARDFNETKAFGDLNSRIRSAEQTEIGRFYCEHAGSQLSRNMRNFAANQKIGVEDNARLFAMVYLTVADSIIAAWDAKYHFGYWRPITAIRAADSDNNETTVQDANWTPLMPTPEHPEYPAAHGSVTAAYAEALRYFFKTKNINITLSSSVTGTSRAFRNTEDLIKEIVDARVYGGMHYRTSGEDGVLIGRNVARRMAKHFFQPAR